MALNTWDGLIYTFFFCNYNVIALELFILMLHLISFSYFFAIFSQINYRIFFKLFIFACCWCFIYWEWCQFFFLLILFADNKLSKPENPVCRQLKRLKKLGKVLVKSTNENGVGEDDEDESDKDDLVR